MKKAKYIGAIIVAICLAIGMVTAQQDKVVYKSNSTIKYYYPSTAKTVNGVYVNNFDEVLGVPEAEAALTSYAQSVKINDLTFYMGSLLDNSGNRTAMRAYLSTLTSLGFTRRASNVTQPSGCIYLSNSGSEASYNAACSTAAQKFTGFTQEWEFWHTNPYGTFSTFKAKDDSILAYCTANSMYYDIYVARCRDYTATFTDAQVATQMVKHETIFLVDYVSTAKYNTYKGLSDGIKTQLNLIGAAAKGASKIQKVCILWASEGNAGANMESYFIANPKLLPAYNGFMTAYNNWSSTNKAFLNITGQKIYATTGLM